LLLHQTVTSKIEKSGTDFSNITVLLNKAQIRIKNINSQEKKITLPGNCPKGGSVTLHGAFSLDGIVTKWN
jgi:hypothetical protein